MESGVISSRSTFVTSKTTRCHGWSPPNISHYKLPTSYGRALLILVGDDCNVNSLIFWKDLFIMTSENNGLYNRYAKRV
jgi:hypothetical protein